MNNMSSVRSLTKKAKVLQVPSQECQAPFDQVKEVIYNSTNPCFLDTEDRFQSYHVCLDGSKYEYAATLSQLLPRRDSDSSPTNSNMRGML